jgi:amino-acid N-acetyltransferase
MKIAPASIAIKPVPQCAQLVQLLSACNLPTSDIGSSGSLQLFGAYAGAELIGAVGLEVYAPVALLRSLAIMTEQRGSGLGKILVEYAERQAFAQGIGELYLLTTTASPFFSKLGYTMSGREDAPATIMATTQFSSLCPSSSIFMRKRLTASTPSRM